MGGGQEGEWWALRQGRTKSERRAPEACLREGSAGSGGVGGLGGWAGSSGIRGGGAAGGRGRASVHGISAGWREGGAEPAGPAVPTGASERAAMALARPWTRDPRPPAPLLLLLPLLCTPALALLAGELGTSLRGAWGRVCPPEQSPQALGLSVWGWGTGPSCGVRRGVRLRATGAPEEGACPGARGLLCVQGAL